jgi:DNA-binding transcriptional regulator YiaG
MKNKVAYEEMIYELSTQIRSVIISYTKKNYPTLTKENIKEKKPLTKEQVQSLTEISEISTMALAIELGYNKASLVKGPFAEVDIEVLIIEGICSGKNLFEKELEKRREIESEPEPFISTPKKDNLN